MLLLSYINRLIWPVGLFFKESLVSDPFGVITPLTCGRGIEDVSGFAVATPKQSDQRAVSVYWMSGSLPGQPNRMHCCKWRAITSLVSDRTAKFEERAGYDSFV